MSDGLRLLAVGWDAAEPTLVAELLAAGDLPALASLLADGGRESTVRADPTLGPIPPWAAFVTGQPPATLETLGLWRWDPSTMTLADHVLDRQPGFWSDDDVTRWGVFDVPLGRPARRAPVAGGFEISGWWTCQLAPTRATTHPPDLARHVARRHPVRGHEPQAPLSFAASRLLAQRCREGIAVRSRLLHDLLTEHTPDAVLAVFHELHWASHRLWHCLSPQAPGPARAAFLDIFREVDRSLAALLSAHPDARVCVFGVHGMGDRRGVPTLTAPLLAHHGFAASTGARSVGRSRLVPAAAKRLRRRVLSERALHDALRARSGPRMDWSRTTAFAMPTEDHGLVRINLAGREAAGVVPASDYRAACDAVDTAFTDARDTEGRALVTAVHRTAAHFGGAPPPTAPDLVIEWAGPAHVETARVAGSAIAAPLADNWITGQHRFEGLCVARGVDAPSVLAPEDLGDMLTTAARP